MRLRFPSCRRCPTTRFSGRGLSAAPLSFLVSRRGSRVNVEAHIQTLVLSDLPRLAPHLRDWAERHLIGPRLLAARVDPDKQETVRVWLVTDDVGEDDSSDRIVFDPEANAFGHLTTLDDGTLWYRGPARGGFADAVRNL